MVKNTKKTLQPIKITSAESGDADFFRSIGELIQQVRSSLEKQVNTTMVVTYFEIGRRIIEKEQQGARRAQYGKKILQGLSDYLTAQLGKGWSIENLKLMRRFYIVYAERTIGETVFTQSIVPIGESLITQFNPTITWTHYLLLMRINNPDERRFYEIEIANNGWSVREFQRQYDSSLYERLALSRNKKKVRELAAKGQIVRTPQDLFKDPYILEFTGLPEKAEYSETELEQKLIDHLQQFMLELGKGFA